MGRLTAPGGDYCREECGYFRSCKRRGRGDLCKSARFYRRLRDYEDTGLMPEEITARRCPAGKEEKMTNLEKVMYAVSGGAYNNGTFTLLVNPDGTPMLWEGPKGDE